LSKAQVASLLGYKTSAISPAVRSGRFPRPIRIAHNVVRWRTSAIDAWLREHEQAQEDAARAG
jgi:predicted DNA-binding transcriptional regulator AlpA